MERKYRECVLKRKRYFIRILAAALFAGIFGQFIFGAPKNFFKKAAILGTNCLQPAVIKFEAAEDDKEEAPAFLWLFVPNILTYTWQESVPAFSVIEVERSEVYAEAVPQNISFHVGKEMELALLQENIHMEGLEIFSEKYENIFNGELQTVLETGNISAVNKYDFAQYSDTTQLIKDFYVIDASTSPDSDLLDIEKLTNYDCTIDKEGEGPQILIYHSHSQEGFADSVEGDVSTTIVGAGEKLTRLLEEEYGYDVLHHMGIYDVPSRDNAYSNALPDVERVLEENPTIQVVIDLHRDAVAEGRKLVTTIDGKDYARFMFFNGICRGTTGPITYLSNPYLEENMAFSFQAQVIAESCFPGITRKIYLKAWRYNMHLKPRNMLIELGAQTNTVEEIMNTTEVLAFIIDKVLSGQ